MAVQELSLVGASRRYSSCGVQASLVAEQRLQVCGLQVVAPPIGYSGACGILVHRPGMEPGPPALGAQSLSRWTTGEVPK